VTTQLPTSATPTHPLTQSPTEIPPSIVACHSADMTAHGQHVM